MTELEEGGREESGSSPFAWQDRGQWTWQVCRWGSSWVAMVAHLTATRRRTGAAAGRWSDQLPGQQAQAVCSWSFMLRAYPLDPTGEGWTRQEGNSTHGRPSPPSGHFIECSGDGGDAA